MNIFIRLARWRKAQRLHHYRIPIKLWQQVYQQALSHYHLNKKEQHRLRELASLFLQQKQISAAQGMQLNNKIRTLIATQACLLILNLDLDYFDDSWQEIIVYPQSFYVEMEQQDGEIIQKRKVLLGGEAWGRGPVILSWQDAKPGAAIHGKGSNVILHEFAHKLDMLNGKANGMPPLHANMSIKDWTNTFSHSYQDLIRTLQRHHHPHIDPYAAENPAEFFAVVSEEFFETPNRLKHYYPQVYQQLRLFYRQDPIKRLLSNR